MVGFLEKNRDTLRDELRDLICLSPSPFISALLDLTEKNKVPDGNRRGTGPRKRPTVAAIFAESLASLISTMSLCQPYFVRCVKPNESKAASLFSSALVLEQLRYSGMLETIRIRKAGFPVRMDFPAFVFRFRALVLSGTTSKLPTSMAEKSAKDLTKLIIQVLPASSKGSYQLGVSKIFLREASERKLEELRSQALSKKATLIQARVRAWLAVKRYQRIREAVVTLQSFSRMVVLKQQYHKKRQAAIVLQSFFRMIKPRKSYMLQRDERRRQRALEREAARAAGLRTVADVSTLVLPAGLATILDSTPLEKCMYTSSTAIVAVEQIGILYL